MKKPRNLFILSGIVLVILALVLTVVTGLHQASNVSLVTPIIGGLGIGLIIFGTRIDQRR